MILRSRFGRENHFLVPKWDKKLKIKSRLRQEGCSRNLMMSGTGKLVFIS